MTRKTSWLLPSAAGAYLCLVLASAAVAQQYSSWPYAGGYPYRPWPAAPQMTRVAYAQPYGYNPYGYNPSQPWPTGPQGYCPPPVPVPVPAVPQLPSTTPSQRPGETPGTRPGERPDNIQNQQNQQQNPPQQPEQQQPETPNAPEAAPSAGAEGAATAAEGAGAALKAREGAPGGGGGGGAVAGGAPMGGRGDSNNRLNLFDNQSAYPVNRVWMAYQFQQGFVTGVGLDPNNPLSSASFAGHRNESLYRLGAEIAPGYYSCFGVPWSISFQTEYIASTHTDNSADAWGNPEFIWKMPLILNECEALSLMVGVQPETSSHDGELHEKTTRLYPGVLFYQAILPRWFVQGGLQFGIATGNAPNTVDYALATGFWLYQAQPCPCSGCCKPLITGVLAQLEVFGKNVLAHGSADPFDITDIPGTPVALFREPRNVYDMTAGGQVLLGDHVYFGNYVSFPLTGSRVRNTEFITSLNVLF